MNGRCAPSYRWRDMRFGRDLTASTLALTLGLAAAWPAWAAPGFVDLPSGEAPAEWAALLARHGLREVEGGVQVEVGPPPGG